MHEILGPSEINISKERKEIPGILRIGIDLDGNVDDLAVWTCRLIRRRFKINFSPQDITTFFIDETPKIQAIPQGPKFIQAIFARNFIYERARLIPGANLVLKRWKDQGHQLWFITARRETDHRLVTFDWLERHDLGWAAKRVLFLGPSGESRVDFKPRLAYEFDLHVFIEDQAEAVRAINSHSIMARLVMRYPWNTNEDIGQARFVNNWQEMDKIINDLSHQHYLLHSQQ